MTFNVHQDAIRISSIFLDSIASLQFSIYIFILIKRFTSLKFIFPKYSGLLLDSSRFKEITKIHDNLCHVAKIFNDAFSVQLLLKFIVSFVSMTGSLFYGYIHIIDETEIDSVIIPLIWLMYGLLETGVICAACTIASAVVSIIYFQILRL